MGGYGVICTVHTVSVVIPVFRNSGSIRALASEVKRCANKAGVRLELLLIDDGSDDGSAAAIRSICAEIEGVIGLRLDRNHGQVTAVGVGMGQASGHAVAVMAADMQDPPDALIDMVHQWHQGADLVVGIRRSRIDTPQRKFASHLFYGLIKLYPGLGQMPAGGFDFFLMDKALCEQMVPKVNRWRFFQADLLSLSRHLAMVPYTRRVRAMGRSQYSWATLLRYAIIGLLRPTMFLHLMLGSMALGAFTTCAMGRFGLMWAIFTALVAVVWAIAIYIWAKGYSQSLPKAKPVDISH